MAVGRATVCTRTVGQTDVIVDRETGRYVPPGDAAALRAVIEELLADPAAADAMGAALVELGFETRDGNPEALHDIAHYMLKVAIEFQKRAYLERDMRARVGRELPDKIRENPIVRIPSHVVLLGRVLGLLSGVSRSLGSRVDLVRTILPYAFAPQAKKASEVESPGRAGN